MEGGGHGRQLVVQVQQSYAVEESGTAAVWVAFDLCFASSLFYRMPGYISSPASRRACVVYYAVSCMRFQNSCS